ncbi:MAG: phosphoribosylanthranilate isomerase [Gemmatimonadaceae bacterium]
MTPVPRVKICCIGNMEEARLAIRLGASAIGLVSRMPSGPGPIDEELIAEIAAQVPGRIATFLLTCHQDVTDIVAQQRRCGTTTLQLCDRLVRGTYADLRRLLPGVTIVQVIHVTGEEALAEAESVAGDVDALLLDSGNPALATKQLGGTGRTHDWNISRRIRERIGIPVFLAGGLGPANIAAAVREVEPFGVDVCSGVRTGGMLDEKKASDFIIRATTVPAA